MDHAMVKEIVESPVTADLLRRYKFITKAMSDSDVSADYTFQKSYCDLYAPLKAYSEKFRTHFFYILEDMKDRSSISFRDAIEKLQEIEGNIEMMPASIMVHTINPRNPIWDKDTAKKYFGIDEHEEGAPVERCCKRFEDFSDMFYAYTNSPEGMVMVKAFDERFPNAEIPDVIKVGFIIWQEK